MRLRRGEDWGGAAAPRFVVGAGFYGDETCFCASLFRSSQGVARPASPRTYPRPMRKVTARKAYRISTAHPFLAVRGHKRVVIQFRISEIDSINLPCLTGTQGLVWVQTPDSFQQPLAAQHLVNARDAAGVTIRSIEESGVGVGDFHGTTQQVHEKGCPRRRDPPALREQFDRRFRPDSPMTEQPADDAALDD